jgi:hypothetical protein
LYCGWRTSKRAAASKKRHLHAYIHKEHLQHIHTCSTDPFTSHFKMSLHIHIHTYMHSGPRGAEPHHPEQQETGIPFRREATQPKQRSRQCRTHTYVHTQNLSLNCMYAGCVCGQRHGDILERSTA